MALSITGFTWAGTLTRAPATDIAVSPRLTCAVRLGSMRQFAASIGLAVMATLPRISALAFSALMLTLPICLATLPPSRLPSASPSAPLAVADNEPVTFRLPVRGVESDNTFCAPVAVIGPRAAVQLISAFCRIWLTGLSALPAKLRGAPRSTASRIAFSVIATGVMIDEVRGTGESGGNSTSAGALPAPSGDSQSMALRLIRNDAAIRTVASRIVLRRIVTPERLSARVYRAATDGARARSGFGRQRPYTF